MENAIADVIADAMLLIKFSIAIKLNIYFISLEGVSVISKIMEDPKLRWISPVEEVETQESDVFTLLGPAYTSLRFFNESLIFLCDMTLFLKVMDSQT